MDEEIVYTIPSWVRLLQIVQDKETNEVMEVHLYRKPAAELDIQVGEGGIESSGYAPNPAG
jgi:hypothetical protein